MKEKMFREKLMEYEWELLPMIKEKCIRIKQDIFIENALYFFMSSIKTYDQGPALAVHELAICYLN